MHRPQLGTSTAFYSPIIIRLDGVHLDVDFQIIFAETNYFSPIRECLKAAKTWLRQLTRHPRVLPWALPWALPLVLFHRMTLSDPLVFFVATCLTLSVCHFSGLSFLKAPILI